MRPASVDRISSSRRDDLFLLGVGSLRPFRCNVHNVCLGQKRRVRHWAVISPLCNEPMVQPVFVPDTTSSPRPRLLVSLEGTSGINPWGKLLCCRVYRDRTEVEAHAGGASPDRIAHTATFDAVASIIAVSKTPAAENRLFTTRRRLECRVPVATIRAREYKEQSYQQHRGL